MALFLDGEATIEPSQCHECGADYLLIKSFVLDETGPHAIAFTALHRHQGVHEAWMDVVFGEFHDTATDNRVTFGCRVGPVEGSNEPAATAVQAGIPYGDSATFGRKLSREEALGNPGLEGFWKVVDFLLESEPAINHHLYGHASRPRTKWWRRG